MKISIIACGVTALATLGCGVALASEVIHGTATYLEQVRLPEEAVLKVSLEEVSRADAPSRELGSVRVQNLKSPPFSFEIPFDPGAINERLVYTVRATIRSGDTLLFTTDTFNPVLTRGAGNEVEVMLRWQGHGTGTPGHVEISSPLGRMPASFEGGFSNDGGSRIKTHLDLFDDGMYFLGTTSPGQGAGIVRDAIGSWVLAGDDDRLALFGDDGPSILLRIIDSDTLQMLKGNDRGDDSSVRGDLRRSDTPGTIEPRLKMRGMYRYMADAALFEECLTGHSFAVATEGDNAALERASLGAQGHQGEPLLVSMDGSIARRPAMEGGGTVLTVVPEHFIGVWPGETCGSRMTISELFDTRWKLIRIGNEPVLVAENQRELHLVLHSEDHRVSGFAGCNSFRGGFEIEGRTITFGQMASTMMACISGGEMERAFLKGLEKAAVFHKTAHHLDLLDGENRLLLRFEARNLG